MQRQVASHKGYVKALVAQTHTRAPAADTTDSWEPRTAKEAEKDPSASPSKTTGSANTEFYHLAGNC